MRIRTAIPADAEPVAALLAELGYPSAPDAIAARLAGMAADSASCALVAEEGVELLGLASLTVMPLLHEDGGWARISALVVAEERRRGGLGRALVAAAEDEARARGGRWVEVTSGDRPDREAAHRFYTALGYEQVSRRFRKAL